MKTLIAISMATVGLMAFPAAGLAEPSNAAKECAKLRADMGKTTFAQTFGTNKNKRNAFGKCVSKQTKVDDNAHSNASKDCKAEQAADPAAFANKYGTNKNKTNAHGRCVSSKAKATAQLHHDGLLNAAKQCRTERNADPAAFKAKYGTNANKANAFGKCVSKLAGQKPPVPA